MKTITIKLERSEHVPYSGGQQIAAGELRLASIKETLIREIGSNRGRIVYLRPSWPGQTSPVTLYDRRPERNYVGGLWAR
jgi:hypothetical protein